MTKIMFYDFIKELLLIFQLYWILLRIIILFMASFAGSCDTGISQFRVSYNTIDNNPCNLSLHHCIFCITRVNDYEK